MSSKLHDPYFQWLDYKALGLLDSVVEPMRTEVLPAREFRRKFINTSTPCIITDATKDWPAFSKWSFDYFKTNFGSTPIPICYNDGQPQMSTVGEYIDELLTYDPRCGERIGHAKNVLMPKYIDRILADLRFPRYHPTDRLTHRGLWFAFDCATSNVHADFGHNMNLQVVGRRHFRLSGPTTIEPRFFHTRDYRTNYSFLDYDEPAPAANGNPAMPKMKAEYSFILERGEILFVPYGWWHKVTSIGPSISATNFWLTPAMVLTSIGFIAGLGDLPRQLLMKLIGPPATLPRGSTAGRTRRRRTVRRRAHRRARRRASRTTGRTGAERDMSAPTPIYNARLQWLDHTAPGILDGLVSPPRTEALPPAEFRRKFVNAGLPCIITGATKDWTALSKWSFDWFKTQYGTTQIPIGTDDGNPRMQPIAEYIDRLLSFDAKAGKQLGYAKNVLINKYISGISADVRFPRYHPFDRLTHDGLWFAYDGATSTTHADFAHNMNTPIFGRKLFRLSRPSTVDPVFFHTRNYRATSTWLDYDRPAPPLNGQPSMPPIAHDYKFILEPGEIIFIPYGWWHKVTSIGPSISATHFWHTPAIVVTAAAYLAALNSDVPRRILMKQIGPKNGPLPRFPRVPPAANPGKPRDGWAPEEPR